MSFFAKIVRPAFLVLIAVAATRVAESQTRLPRPGNLPEYGTSGVTYYRQSSDEFFPLLSSGVYIGTTSPARGRYGDPLFGPAPHLPGGALLTYLELDYCDVDPEGEVVIRLRNCDYLGVCGAVPLASIASGIAAAPGCSALFVDLTPLNYTVDNFLTQLLPEVDAPGGAAWFTGVLYGYRLQVSPAPAVATFNDVPLGHPFHRYVEALAASGITAGCGGGSFCPGSPVTRGQMAAFLSIALGLHWSQ